MNNTLAKTTKAQFELQTRLFLMITDAISDSEANQHTITTIKSFKWIAGHIVNSRMTLLQILTGKTQNEEFATKFGKGTSANTNVNYPSMSKILKKWELVSNELLTAIEKTTDESLLSKPPFQTSIPDTTLSGLVAFFALHEGQHMGQLSLIRKLGGVETNAYDAVICV